MRKKLKEGRLYKVRFYDHAIGELGAIECEICVWYVRDDSHQYIFNWWNCISNDPQVTLDNMEIVGIVKKAIISVTEL